MQHLVRAPQRGPPEHYYVVETRTESIPVPRWVAEKVTAQLTRFWRPAWITFRDVAGARHTMRASAIYMVRESSAETRAAVRAFYRARDRERDEDNASWE